MLIARYFWSISFLVRLKFSNFHDLILFVPESDIAPIHLVFFYISLALGSR